MRALRWLFVLMVFAAGIAVGLFYFSVWDAWWQGRPITDLRVGGLPIRWWGRIGKYLQFLAGLTIVLDLVGAARLRDAGDRVQDHRARTVDRLDDTRNVFWLVKLERDIFDGIVAEDPKVDSRDPRTWSMRESPVSVPENAAFSLTDYVAFHGAFAASRHKHCSHGPDHHRNVCQEQRERLASLVRQFVLPSLSSEDQQLLERAGHRVGRAAIQLGLAGVCAAVLLMVYLRSDPRFDGEAPWWMILLIPAPAGVIWIIMSRPGIQAKLIVGWATLTSMPLIAAAHTLARFVETAQSKRLRWTAVALFLVGFHLDLLSS